LWVRLGACPRGERLKGVLYILGRLNGTNILTRESLLKGKAQYS
jgi:hypothetical protein